MLLPLQTSSIGTDGMNGYLWGLNITVSPFVMILGTVTHEDLTKT